MGSGEKSEIGHCPGRYILILAALVEQQQFVINIWQRSRLGGLLQPAEEHIDGLLQLVEEHS
jgi:hypothetical protein